MSCEPSYCQVRKEGNAKEERAGCIAVGAVAPAGRVPRVRAVTSKNFAMLQCAKNLPPHRHPAHSFIHSLRESNERKGIERQNSYDSNHEDIADRSLFSRYSPLGTCCARRGKWRRRRGGRARFSPRER